MHEALHKAKEANPGLALELSFIGKFLMLESGERASEQEKSQWVDFIMRLQQLTGPLMAKGFEDTTLYIYNRFLSLNEVGGDPSRFGIDVDAFHEFNLQRGGVWPHGLNATSTHDTKRGEDARARLNVLSEIPDDWERHVFKWGDMNRTHKQHVKGLEAPDRNDEYFLYQSLIGAMPLIEDSQDGFVERVKDYMIKAVREAKVHTGWLKPDTDYEEAFMAFIEKILEPSEANPFLCDFRSWAREVARLGALNSLSQTLLKLTCPGAPDLYQGSELWDLHFVDPDNRRPVDFALRRKFLAEIKRRENERPDDFLTEILANWQDGRVKLFLIYKALNLRQRLKDVFQDGRYIPLSLSGTAANHICAFARSKDTCWAVVAVPRLPTGVFLSGDGPLGRQGAWGDTLLLLPDESPATWLNPITGRALRAADTGEGRNFFYARDIFADFPVALLQSNIDEE
jgi:(1->4)-alpha-D-glucan 1-alpha-D-glucosylmutase